MAEEQQIRAAAAAVRSAAGIHRLTAAQLTTPQIAALCEVPTEEVQSLQADEAIGPAHVPATGSDAAS